MSEHHEAVLRKRSPHLHFVAAQHLDSEGVSLVARAFAYAIARGGEQEIGFARAEGVSFNPRSARVALILLQDGAIRDANTIAAAVLSCADSIEEFEVAAVREGAREAQRSFLDGTGENIVVLALQLDYVRHLHQHERRAELWECERERTERLCVGDGRIQELLRAWYERAGRMKI